MIGTRRLDRLLLLLPSNRLGGTERHTATLAARLKARTGMAVHIAAAPALLPGLAALEPEGAELHPAELAWEGAEQAEERAARQAAETRRLLDDLHPDAALAALPWPDAGSGLLPALAKASVPRLVLLHLAPEAEPPEAVPSLGLDGAMVAAVSSPVARRAALAWGLAPSTVAVLPNPAPRPVAADRAATRRTLRAALGLDASARLLLFVGRLEKAKGAELLPGIAARLKATIAIAGEGPLRELLDRAAAEDGAGRLRLLGQLADPAPWYLAADALLLPSRLEGAPLVFLEAAANGCPVAATPAALEAFGEEAPRVASIADTSDAAGMAVAAAALLGDPARAEALAAAAARLAAGRHWAGVVDQALGLLRGAVLKAGGGLA
ncbi:glycosyltransferase [Roseomonas sp. AR75]|uniref:glycosyltransferase n=1 Tax=Roseomonas sp. AR75 TaxID=2562311 RepID=UPI0010C05129|nr:glycosyltransferase [Roseomonas sp. AR75]